MGTHTIMETQIHILTYSHAYVYRATYCIENCQHFYLVKFGRGQKTLSLGYTNNLCGKILNKPLAIKR